jgi:alkylation response protein AidB-like acyl-CoA dehydrogenase
MASNFLYSTRDHKFIFNEWLDSKKIFSYPKFGDVSEMDEVNMLINMTLDMALKVAETVVAPSNDDGETIGVKLENGQVKLPQSFHHAYKYLNANGWGAEDPEDAVVPHMVKAACKEYFGGANPSFSSYISLTSGAAKLIASFGQPEDKDLFLPRMYSGEWSGTMCLTEPDAGTDVGDTITKAFPTGKPGIYKIKGTKCFITAGDHDLTDNIIHLLLARIDGAAPGTKGLSLFIVPKVKVNKDGSLGDKNDVTTVAVEHKLGLKGSATCLLSFGDNDGCEGVLLGNPPDEKGAAEGMAQMFQLMNSARHGTGHSALYVATVAYNNAVKYAKERIQGRLLSDPKGARVPIIKHEDVRRMLLNQKAILEAMRALVFVVWYYVDIVTYSPDEEERKYAQNQIDILNPLAKAYCSDVAWELVADAIQVYGGSGYIEEYPVAKQARDVKIYSIWEGTNYIQAMDLIGRKWRMENGQLFAGWLAELGNNIEKYQGTTGLEQEFAILQKAFGQVKEIYKTIIKYAGKDFRLVTTFATRVLHAVAMLYCGYLMADQARVALDKISELGEANIEAAFYKGKVVSARYYINNVVPFIETLSGIIKGGDTSVLDIPEEAF